MRQIEYMKDSAGTGVLSSYHEDEDEAIELSNRWNIGHREISREYSMNVIDNLNK